MTISRPNSTFSIVAHRGLSKRYPENSYIGLKAALELPIDMLEIDVHYTKDKQLVVIHDDTIDRTSNGRGKVIDYTYEQLQQFDFGIKWGEAFKGTRISKLEDILQLARQYSKILLIELKVPQQYPGIEDMLLDVLDRYHMPKRQVILQSFDEESVRSIATKTTEYKLGVLISKKKYWHRLPNFEDISQYADYINPNYSIVTKKFIDGAHQVNLKVMPYTVNEAKAAQSLIKLGVDSIITDIPDELFQL